MTAPTIAPAERDRLVVEPLTHYQLALYGSAEFLERHGTPEAVSDLSRVSLVGYVDDMIYAPELRYLDEILPGLAPTLASSSIQAQRAIVAAGGGLGVLPCFLAEGLTRVLEGEVLLERRFWLSTHKDVHGAARLRGVHNWLRELVAGASKALAPY